MERYAFGSITATQRHKKRDLYPSPSMDKCIDSFDEAPNSSFLVGSSKFFLTVEIDKVDRDITAFTFRYGFYRLVRVLFKLRNAPGSS